MSFRDGETVQVLRDHLGWGFLWPALYEGAAQKAVARVRLRCFRPRWGTRHGVTGQQLWLAKATLIEERYVFPLEGTAEELVERQAELVKHGCRACGRYQVALRAAPGEGTDWTVPGEVRCAYCGVRQNEWEFLDRLAELPDDAPLVLRCAYTRRAQPGEEFVLGARCSGTLTFAVGALRQRTHIGGNGPRTYLLDCRFKLQGRCPVCGAYNDASELVRGNRDVLLTAASAGALA